MGHTIVSYSECQRLGKENEPGALGAQPLNYLCIASSVMHIVLE